MTIGEAVTADCRVAAGSTPVPPRRKSVSRPDRVQAPEQR